MERRYTLTNQADVAELADAHGSGPCSFTGVEVRLLSSALQEKSGIVFPNDAAFFHF